jgi:hypothetical protein
MGQRARAHVLAHHRIEDAAPVVARTILGMLA